MHSAQSRIKQEAEKTAERVGGGGGVFRKTVSRLGRGKSVTCIRRKFSMCTHLCMMLLKRKHGDHVCGGGAVSRKGTGIGTDARLKLSCV